MAIGMVRPVGSAIIAWAMKSMLYRPMLAASCTIGQGNSSRSSHSSAAGRITSSAKSWTHFWSWIWSSFNSREKLPLMVTVLCWETSWEVAPDRRAPVVTHR